MALRPPQQKRSRKTLSRIEGAGLAILREQGPEGLTVQEVVTRARTSVGSFYQRFSGKEELLRHLEGALVESERTRFEDALGAGAVPDRTLTTIVEAIVALLAAETGIARAAPPDDAVVRPLLAHRGEIRHADPEIAIRIGYAAVAGALGERPAGVGERTLTEELARLWLVYLTGGKSAGGAADAVDFFEVWG